MPNESILLTVENLKVAYPNPGARQASGSGDRHDGGPVWALDDICLTLRPGQRLGLVGESGCGKSTLGKAILRLLPKGSRVEGHLLLEGQPILDLSPGQLRRFRGEAVGLVFQDPMTRLNPLMTIGRHCLETLQAHRPQMSKQQAKERAIETLAAVKIPADRWNQYPHEFSGGMRQRVAIALALLLNPKLIVADEPTTSLDVTVSAQILDELTRLCAERDMGLLMISHDLALVGEYCDRIAVMYQGKLVELDRTEQLLSQPQHPYTQSLLNSALHLQRSAVDKADRIDGAKAPILRLEAVKQHFSLSSNPLERLLSGQAETLIKAVDGISFDLLPGETLGLVGESGCGKARSPGQFCNCCGPRRAGWSFWAKTWPVFLGPQCSDSGVIYK